jgi:hypothetical protein
MPSLESTLVVNFTLPKTGLFGRKWETASISIGDDGEIYHLCRETVSLRDNSGMFALTKTDQHHYRLQIWKDDKISSHELGAYNQPFSDYQPLGKASGILVGARCSHYPDGTSDKNAIIYDFEKKQVTQKLTLGDGIQSVQTTASGKIWCSFFDEGTRGKNGWDRFNGPEPLGASGLVAYDTNGNKLYEYAAPANDSTDLSILDCYALNVIGEDVWLCPYTDFPLIKISENGTINWWQTPKAAHRSVAFAIGNDEALFLAKDKLILLKLDSDNKSHILQEFTYSALPQKCTVVAGRNKNIYLFSDTSVYQIAWPHV